MRYAAKDIGMIGVIVAITVVIGYIFYIAGSFLPIPGSKFLIFAPFLGFAVFIPTYKLKKIGTVTVVSMVFAAVMLVISIFISAALLRLPLL